MAEHSPLPWSAVDFGKGMDDEWQVIDKNERPVTVMTWQWDAEFIVRCVNSHEALLEALKLAYDHHVAPDWVMEKMGNAIVLAEATHV